jgi:hypothetical protein
MMDGTSLTARAAPGDLFVTPAGGGTCSQSSPCDLQTALTNAGSGDAIYMAQGTYTGSGSEVIDVIDNITIYGGWDGAASGPVVVDPDAYPSTVDGQGQRRGVVVDGSYVVTLEGFTVTNGVTTYGGAGLYARNATITLNAMTIYSNVIDVADTPGTDAYGGGAFVEGGTLHVEATTFRGNSAWAGDFSFGGGLAISRTMVATVTGSLFAENDAWHAGGLYFTGVWGRPVLVSSNTFVDNGKGLSSGRAYCGSIGALTVSYAQARIEGNMIRGNRAVNGRGSVEVRDSDLVLASNVITGNQNGQTSALFLYDVSFTATNNVFAGNENTYYWRKYPAISVHGNSSGRFVHNTVADNIGRAGILVESGSSVWLTNTILVSQTVGISVTAGSTATLEGTLWGSGAWANGTDWGGGGSISTDSNTWGDPAFVSPGDGDYHITPDSDAVDAGVDAGVTTDIDGDTRPAPVGTLPDLGADEVDQRWVYLPLVLRSD